MASYVVAEPSVTSAAVLLTDVGKFDGSSR
jgi:hypothetical protein